MTLTDFIKKYRLNKVFISEQIGMHDKTFMNKWNGHNGSRFSEEERSRILSVLKDMGVDIKKIDV